MFLRRFPPEVHLRHANHSDSSSDSSDSDQDLDHLIPSQAAVTFSFDEDMQPGSALKQEVHSSGLLLLHELEQN